MLLVSRNPTCSGGVNIDRIDSTQQHASNDERRYGFLLSLELQGTRDRGDYGDC